MDNKVVVHTHNGIFLTYEKKCISVSSNEVDLEPTIQSEVNQEEKHQNSIFFAYIWNLERQ